MDRAAFVLAATGAHVARQSRVQSLWAGYGEIMRLTLSDGRSVVLKEVSPPRGGDDDRSHARKVRSYAVETAFYRDHAPLADEACRVAHMLGADEGPPLRLLLEDLDAAGFALRRGRSRDLVGCVAWLAAFHARFLGHAPSGLWPEGSYWHLATRPDELARTTDPELVFLAPHLDAALAGARHRTLVHGDAKPANFCFAGDGRVAAVDFQYVGGGVGVRDLAYLLHGLDRDDEARLVERYFEDLGAHVSSAVVDEWRALYPVAAADFVRFLAGWAGSYGAADRAVVRRAMERLDG